MHFVSVSMSKRKVTFEDGDGEITLEEDVPKKKVAAISFCYVYVYTVIVCCFMKIRKETFMLLVSFVIKLDENLYYRCKTYSLYFEYFYIKLCSVVITCALLCYVYFVQMVDGVSGPGSRFKEKHSLDSDEEDAGDEENTSKYDILACDDVEGL